MSDQLPEDVRRFIVEHINSVEQLEVLLLLRAHPEQDWSADAVSQRLYTPPPAAAMRLSDLQARGFLSASDDGKVWRYRPANAEVDAFIASLAEHYQERRVTVITLIYSKPHQQVQAFADAFKLRKDG